MEKELKEKRREMIAEYISDILDGIKTSKCYTCKYCRYCFEEKHCMCVLHNKVANIKDGTCEEYDVDADRFYL